jgi:hypothetical protein
MNNSTPKYLYKYRPINKHTLNMILSNEAHFSLPKDFNDPFDCNIIPELIYTEQEVEAFISSQRLRPGAEAFQKELQDLQSDPTGTLDKHFRDSVNNVRKGVRIFCLSEANDNVMMYSHYADSHRGLCIEFQVQNDPFFELLNCVSYPEKIPQVHPFDGDKFRTQAEIVDFEIRTKSISWSYEKEWRIIKQEPDPSFYNFGPNVLTALIFGFQTPQEDRFLVEDIVRDRKPSIQLKEAVKIEKSFNLEIRPCNIQQNRLTSRSS